MPHKQAGMIHTCTHTNWLVLHTPLQIRIFECIRCMCVSYFDRIKRYTCARMHIYIASTVKGEIHRHGHGHGNTMEENEFTIVVVYRGVNFATKNILTNFVTF